MDILEKSFLKKEKRKKIKWNPNKSVNYKELALLEMQNSYSPQKLEYLCLLSQLNHQEVNTITCG